MRNCKRVEIIINQLEVDELIEILDRHKFDGYSYINNVNGSGDRGWHGGDELSGAFQNSLFIIACTEDQFNSAADDIRTLLDDVGGVCIISEAQRLR